MPDPEDQAMSKATLQLEGGDGFYVSVGDVIAGKYRVERVLGRGGMAFVLSARHVELDQCFALKFLDERFLGNEKLTERFTQEARAACKIRSEHVARVYDVGTHNGAPFFVMEHLEGRDLAAVMAERGPLEVEDAVEYVMQVCEALAVAHSEGIVHRDIKPENLFLVEREGPPLVKVLDFGISKVPLTGGEPASRLTGELRMGTPCYMSPEQIRSTASADGRSDLWSLGVVLYELLGGREAFRADSVNAVCAAVLELDPPPLSQLRPDLPDALVDVIMKCLEKSPDRRFADVAELAGALLPFAPSRALVSAERSSSLMRGARRVGATPATSASEPAPFANDAPPSEAPLVRSVAAVGDTRSVRRAAVAMLSVVSAAVGLVTVVHLLGAPAPSSLWLSPSPSPSSQEAVSLPAEATGGDVAEVAIGVSTSARLGARTPDAAAAPPAPAVLRSRSGARAAAAAAPATATHVAPVASDARPRPIAASATAAAAVATTPAATIDLGY